jgi:hypothetical protein
MLTLDDGDHQRQSTHPARSASSQSWIDSAVSQPWLCPPIRTPRFIERMSMTQHPVREPSSGTPEARSFTITRKAWPISSCVRAAEPLMPARWTVAAQDLCAGWAARTKWLSSQAHSAARSAAVRFRSPTRSPRAR